MAISTNSLVSLATLKAFLGITSTTDDTVLEYSIDRASALIQRYCARNFVSQRYYEWHDTYGADRVALRHNPVENVRFVGVGGDNVISVDSTISTDIACTISVNDTHVHLFRAASNGQETSTTLTFASHDSTVEMATQISATTGFSASALLNVKTHYLRKMAGRDLKQQTALLEAPTEGLTDYAIDYDRGIVYGPTLRRYQGFLVDYTGGFASVPYDIEQAATSIATRLYRGRKRDNGVASESLGGYSYSLRSGSEIEMEEKSMLDGWRRLR
jgi:hypothetical protein